MQPLSWFCLYTMSGSERRVRDKAAEALRARFGGHGAVTVGPDTFPWECWYPVATRVHSVKTGGMVRVEFPAIHNYVFVRIPADPAIWHSIADVDGVIEFLGAEDEDGYSTPLAIPEGEMQALMLAEQTGEFDAFEKWRQNKKRREAKRKAARKGRPLSELAAALAEQEGEAA